MSKKILPNRISKIVTPEMRAKVVQGFQLLNEALGEDTLISDEDYKKLRKLADVSKLTCDDVYDIAKANQGFIEEPLTFEEITKDKEFYEFCDEIYVLKKSFDLKLEREQNLGGSEYANAMSVFENDIKDKVNRGGNNAKAVNVKNQLDGIDRKRAGSKKKIEPTTPTVK